MKRTLLAAISIIIIFFSCRKESNTQVIEEEKNGVKVMISDTLSTGTLDDSTVERISDYAHYLYYFVYNSSGRLVRSSVTPYELSETNVIDFDLPSGTYTSYVAASADPLLISDPASIKTFRMERDRSYWNSIFVKKFALNIQSGTATDTTINLVKVMGELVVNLKNPVPANGALFEVIIQNEAGGLRMVDERPMNTVKTTRTFPIKSSNKSFMTSVLRTSVPTETLPTDVTLRILTAERTVLVEKEFKQLLFYPGQQTIIDDF